MVFLDLAGNIGFTLAIIGLLLWVVGEVLPKAVKELASLAGVGPIGKTVFFLGIILFIILLIV